jgi:hypothetical protein
MNMSHCIHGVIYLIRLVHMFLGYNIMEKIAREFKENLSLSSNFPCAIELKFESNY